MRLVWSLQSSPISVPHELCRVCTSELPVTSTVQCKPPCLPADTVSNMGCCNCPASALCHFKLYLDALGDRRKLLRLISPIRLCTRPSSLPSWNNRSPYGISVALIVIWIFRRDTKESLFAILSRTLMIDQKQLYPNLSLWPSECH